MTVAGGTLFGAGAFSTVQADRTVDVSTAGDGSALLGLSENSSALVGMSGDSTLQISNDQLNRNATTIANSSIDVTNNGENGVGLYVNSTSDAFDIHHGGSSIEGSANAVDIGTGTTESLTLVIDLTGDNTEADLPSGVQFVADTSEHGA